MMKRTFGLLVLLWSLQLVGFAQVGGAVVKDTLRFGEVILVQDPGVTRIVEREVTVNRRKGGIDGYRIQIFFNSGRKAREEALKTKADFLSGHPDIPVYIVYHAPFYKVRVGNFRSKDEALGVFHQLRKHYPSAYIVKDVIPFPELD